MLEIKYIVTEMKNIFDKLISRLETAKERITETEDKSIEVPQTEKEEKKRVKKKKNRTKHPILWNNIKQCNNYVLGIHKSMKFKEHHAG